MEIVVDTALGKVTGVQEGDLQAFRGIPFAKPPVGALRLCAPEPPDPWSGVRPALEFAPSAPQNEVEFDLIPGLGVGRQSEDCLYLNVITPAADDGRRPVMVWIHGGAFIIGSGSQALYDTRPLALRGDCVLVSINYRLGALGFLHLADVCGEGLGATANAGILDQVAALVWVRDNIAAFGGDPGNVTIFGESAGGMSVGTLMGMPAARGLFHRAIAQSGAAQTVSSAEEAGEVARLFLAKLGIEPADCEKLRGVSVGDILAAQTECALAIDADAGLRAFRPAVDSRSLPEHPLDAIRGGMSRDVSVIVGSCRDEWRLFGFMDPAAAKLDEAALIERIDRRVPGADAVGRLRGRGLVDAYRPAAAGGETPADLFLAIETDRVFGIPAIRLAEAQQAHQKNTFAYLVTWESPFLGGSLGACHGIDVPFVFGAIGSPGANAFAGEGPEAHALCERMMDAWIHFARSGDPNHPGLPRWPGYDPRRRATLFFGRRCEVQDDPGASRRRAWEGLL
jgi:para-nitrobenzyl esterase